MSEIHSLSKTLKHVTLTCSTSQRSTEPKYSNMVRFFLSTICASTRVDLVCIAGYTDMSSDLDFKNINVESDKKFNTLRKITVWGALKSCLHCNTTNFPKFGFETLHCHTLDTGYALLRRKIFSFLWKIRMNDNKPILRV